MVVLCKFALCNKNTILPSAQYKPHTLLLLLLLPNKIYPLSLPHPHAFEFRRRHTHQIEDADAMPTLIWFVVFFFFHRRRSKPSADRAFVFAGANASSLPVNISDWSKILRDEYRDNRSGDNVDYDNVDGDDESPKPNLGKNRLPRLRRRRGNGEKSQLTEKLRNMY
jgi:hypothetical protein